MASASEARPHEWLTTEGVCPRCGSTGELVREEADVGVGVIYGPWACPCGWSESEEYDMLYGGGVQADGAYLTSTGVLYPAENPVAQFVRLADELWPGTARSVSQRAVLESADYAEDLVALPPHLEAPIREMMEQLAAREEPRAVGLITTPLPERRAEQEFYDEEADDGELDF